MINPAQVFWKLAAKLKQQSRNVTNAKHLWCPDAKEPQHFMTTGSKTDDQSSGTPEKGSSIF